MPTNKFLLLLSVIVGVAAAGCNSQMDSIPDPVISTPNPAPAGYYTGKRISVSNDDDIDVIALIDAKSSIRISSLDGTELYSGIYQTNGSNLTIAARRYTPPPPPSVDENGDPVVSTAQTIATVNGEGSFDSDNNLLLSYLTSDNDSGQFKLSYQGKDYEMRSDLTLIAGQWGQIDTFGAATISISIDNGGNLFGQDALTTCIYSGSFSTIDIHYNLYSLALKKQCGGTTSSTTGLAILLTPVTGNQRLIAISGSITDALLLDLSPL